MCKVGRDWVAVMAFDFRGAKSSRRQLQAAAALILTTVAGARGWLLFCAGHRGACALCENRCSGLVTAAFALRVHPRLFSAMCLRVRQR